MQIRDIISGLSGLIARGVPEEEVQKYIEMYPWLVTGACYPESNVVISKLPLGADHCTDFAFFWSQSGGNYIQLVEIESPRLEVFTREDDFGYDFNKAVQQLADWEDWCERRQDTIRGLIESLYEQDLICDVPSYSRTRMLLIAGRRSNIQANARRKRRWEQKVNELSGSRVIRTWEGFVESLPLAFYDSGGAWRDIHCVRYRKQGYSELVPRDY